MFIRPPRASCGGFAPDWTVLQLPSFTAEPDATAPTSATVIALDLASRLVLIGGTAYAGEIKKSIFTVLNYLLPERGVMPMHCSANVGAGRATSPSSSACRAPARRRSRPIASRTLIGDDEHGWGDAASSTSRAAATPR